MRLPGQRLNSLLVWLRWWLPCVASWLAAKLPPSVAGGVASLYGFLVSDKTSPLACGFLVVASWLATESPPSVTGAVAS